MPKRATIKDIASLTNSSVTAVSLTLNNRPNRLSDATKRRIFEAAAELNYIPNQNARNLVSNRSMLLGLIVPDIQNTFFANLAKNLSDECTDHGYALVIANSNDNETTEQLLMQRFHSHGLDAVMIVPSLQSFDNPKRFRKLIENSSIPVMILDRISALPWCDGVGYNNYYGGQLAARYMLQQGHRDVGIIAAQSTYMDKDGRITGFRDVMAEAGYPIPNARITEGKFRFEGGFTAIEALLEQKVTAVFCGNDNTALGAISRLTQLGLRVPDDISIMGYDNDIAPQGLGIGLTTIDQNVAELCKVALEHLLARVEADSEISDTAAASCSTGTQLSTTATEQPRTSEPQHTSWLQQPQRELLTPRLIERATVVSLL